MPRLYHEAMPPDLARLFKRRGVRDLKVELWNTFFDSDLLEICDEDISALPRFLPLSYLPDIRAAARDVTEFLMKLLSLPAGELRALLPPTPVTSYLIDRLGVLDRPVRRITGGMRYDFAVEGPPVPGNPPKLLEINEIGFDGTGRSSHIQEALLRLFPELRKRVRVFDTAASEARNMLRLGRRLLRIQYDFYNWEEEVLYAKAQRLGLAIDMVSPAEFGLSIHPDYPLLRRAPVTLQRGRLAAGRGRPLPDAVQIAYSLELRDLKEGRGLFKRILKSRTPQYGPFILGLAGTKSILLLLDSADLAARFLGRARAARLRKAIVPAGVLAERAAEVQRSFHDFAIKHADGLGGEQVFVGREIPAGLQTIPAKRRREWIVQQRIYPNTVDADGFKSRRRKVMADLGVFVHFDWNGERFDSFSTGGFVTRASSRSLKMNMSRGGIVLPVMFDRAR